MESVTKAMKRFSTSVLFTPPLLGALALLSTGCMQEPLCPEKDACGGAEPVGTWQLQPGQSSCTEDLYVPPTDPRLRGGEVPVARQPIIEPAFFDWCTGLLTNGGMKIQTRAPVFFFDSGQVGSSSLSYTPDPAKPGTGTYQLGTVRTGTYFFDFPAYCMRSFGAMDGRSAYNSAGMAVTDPTNVCKQLEIPLNDSGVGEGAYQDIACNPNPSDPEGCLCQFDVGSTGGSTGNYQMLDSNTILHVTATNTPHKVTFCNKGSSLELTGENGAYLFGLKGLRTMTLAKSVL